MAHLSPLFSWRSAIVSSELSSTTKHVALTLSLYMSERGDSAFPAVPTLSRDTSLSRRTVQVHLSNLVDDGWLTSHERAGMTTIYTATIPNIALPAIEADEDAEELPVSDPYEMPPATPAGDAPPQEMHPRSSQHQPPHLTTKGGAPAAPYVVIEDDKESVIQVAPLPPRPKPPASGRGGPKLVLSIVPEDFKLTAEHRQWAEEQRFHWLDLDRLTAEFLDHWRGNGQKKADWTATWRNWVRRADAYARRDGRRPAWEKSDGEQPKANRNRDRISEHVDRLRGESA